MSTILYYFELGISKFTFWLDNAKTHKKKMRTYFSQYLEDMGIKGRIEVEFIHIPAYSPKMNAAEYFIQIIRKKFLKHIPPGQTIEQVLERLLPKIDGKQILTIEKMQNILARIKRFSF